jgi:hypothetical protein
LNDNDIKIKHGEKLRHQDGEEFLLHIGKAPFIKNYSVPFEYIFGTLLFNQYYRYLSGAYMGEDCLAAMEDNYAFVTIEVKTSSMIAREKDITVTFEEKLARLGKFMLPSGLNHHCTVMR